jgi:leucyl aminopeptidase
MAYNPAPRPGRPQGGEVLGVRAAFEALRRRYGGGSSSIHPRGDD